MTRSRPPTLLTLAHRLIRDEQLFQRGESVLCACSGGPDSNALLHVLALLRTRVGHRLVAVGVDHGLRAEAGEELAVAQRLAAQHRVPFHRASVRVTPGANLQARARQARQAVLQKVARRAGATVIATGHTADDRAETVLMRLLRGTGPRGLAVLPARSPAPTDMAGPEGADLVRPLIRARRADVMAHLERHGLPFCEDPSNYDRRFLRVRVRHQLLPLLEELSPGVVGHLCALADMMLGAGQDDPLGSLTRSQRLALDRALRLRKGRVTVRVSGGRELQLQFRTSKAGARRKK